VIYHWSMRGCRHSGGVHKCAVRGVADRFWPAGQFISTAPCDTSYCHVTFHVALRRPIIRTHTIARL
jgi:hypothetical protein